MNICYEGSNGISDIRTCIIEEILYISMTDVLTILNIENREINKNNVVKSMASVLRRQLEALDTDEYIRLPVEHPRFESEKEIFLTQPGLYRVLSTDNTKAGKKFQKWVFHDVIPSLTKYGVYPPPKVPTGSPLTQMAELLAQTLRRQDEIASDVNNVKNEVKNLDDRVAVIEVNNKGLKYLSTVRERIEEKELELNQKQEDYIVEWCEKITIEENHQSVKCLSDERNKTRFKNKVIDTAIERVVS